MTTTTYLELEDQTTGSNDNTWGDVLDQNMAYVELAIARVLGLSTTGGSTTLTTAQNRYPIIKVTGVLVSNATIVVRTAEKNWIFINATTGNYTVTVKTLSGTGKTLPRGKATQVYCDGTNVELIRPHGIPHAAAGGTADAITATFEPATTSAEIQDGYLWSVEAGSANATTTPTFTPDGGSSYTIKKLGAQALVAGDIRGAGHKLLLQYDASGGHVELLNPASGVAASDTVAGVIELATDAETQTGTATNRAITPANLTAKEASAAQYRNNTADRILTTDIVYSAASPVALSWTSGGTTAVDLNSGLNFTLAAATGNSTLGAPTNAKTGQSGFIKITQDSTPRTLAFASAWYFAGGTDPTLSTGSGAIDILYYTVIDSTGPIIHASLVKAIA